MAAICVSVAGVSSVSAVTVLNFEGVGDSNPVGNFYDGGGGGSLGVTFSTNALGIVDYDIGGTGNIGGEPSSSTVLYFDQGPSATLNASSGFDTGFSFYYSSIYEPGFVTVYDGLNGTGNILATLILPITLSDGGDPTGEYSPFVPIGLTFNGTARSVALGGVANRIVFDDVTLGSKTPGNRVPDGGATITLFGLALAGINAMKRKLVGA